MFYKKVALKPTTGKSMEKETPVQIFLCEFCEIFQISFCTERVQMATNLGNQFFILSFTYLMTETIQNYFASSKSF